MGEREWAAGKTGRGGAVGGGQMGRHEVGAQKWVAGKWRGEEGVSVTDEGAASQTRARNHPRGCSVTDEGAVGLAARMRVW